MKIKITILILVGIWAGAFAQKNNEFAAIDKIMLQIPDSMTKNTQGFANYINLNFSKHSDKARAIFIWVASNIEYDVENMFALKSYQNSKEVIPEVLMTRKGICMHYAELFNDIAIKAGLKSYVVAGYTKQNGFVDYISHAWCAAFIDTAYFIFDPTWGSGYVQKSKFVRQINNNYYKALPEQMIKSHMPFDPLFQFLSFPFTKLEFYDGKMKADNSIREYFNFMDSLTMYDKQTDMERLVFQSIRIEKSGVKSSLVYEHLKSIKREIEYHKNKKIVELFNTSVHTFNAGINLLNDFVDYRNKQFKPIKPDPEIKFMLDTVETSFNLAREKIKVIQEPDANMVEGIVELNKSIDRAFNNLNEQREFLVKYFKTSKLLRKTLFYKRG